ncbi:telomerase reverse transcriptase-like isoform X2 [Osmia bicornis bicornis]|nr:telomerase reverse transcriptase-like isoform X2 [Osmia bicornis bicornis]
MVSNPVALKQCLEFLDKEEEQLDYQLIKIQNLCPNDLNYGDHKQKLCKQYIFAPKREQKSCKETTYPPSNLILANLSLEIYLRNTSAILPIRTFHQMTIKCILDTAKTGVEIYKDIINTPVNDIVITDYEASIPSISLLLEKFQKHHKMFHYSSILKHLISKQEVNQKSQCKYAINTKQMKLFFNLVFTKVIPLNIFGKLRNLKKIKKALFHLLKIPCFKALDLKLYINKLDISSINWLQSIKKPNIAWVLLAKFVKWLFTGFLLKVLHTYFHVTTVSSYNNERIYIVRSEWFKINKRFIQRKIRSNALQLDLRCSHWKPPLTVYKLYPKYSTVRPLFVLRYKNDNERTNFFILHLFLKQLHITEYGLSSFEDKWKSIVQHKHTLKDKKLYFVLCDVMDAFGSIIQGKLFDIIRSFCEKLPENLILRNYAVKSKISKDDILCYKQYFCDSHLQLSVPPGTLYARTDHIQQIKKSWLLEKIRKYIFHQTVQIGKKYYIVTKGIVQGGIISPILSDIYFDFVIQKEMAVFLRTGQIIKFVDDMLFVTEDEDSAKQLLQLTAKGIPKYNCRFKTAKTQTNVACNEGTVTNNISFIGYKINCTTSEVQYNIPNINLRYLMSLKKNWNPLKILQLKLCNVVNLKLSNIVLDTRINSGTTIKAALENAGLMQANRACVSINELFDDIQTNAESIFKIIKNSNKLIARFVIKIFLKCEGKVKELRIRRWNKEILSILWASYKRIFIKDTVLRKHFLMFCKK